MRVLLTGASGFVGAKVAAFLVAEGAEVHAVVRSKKDATRLENIEGLSLVEGDLLRDGGMDGSIRTAPEVCIHSAWYAEPGKYLTSPLNVELAYGTARFAAALGSGGCRRFVGVGTCFEYDTDAGYLSEESRLASARIYSAAKVATYLMVKQLAAGTAMSFAWARLFYLFGPGEYPSRLVPFVVDHLLRGEEVGLTPGAQVRDFLYIDDVASALIKVAKSDLTDAVNIGSGEPVTVASLVTRIGVLLGRPDLIRLGARDYAPNDPMFVCANNARLRNTGWIREYSLDQGLERTVHAARARGGHA